MQAFSSDSTWHKSKVFIERAIKARDEIELSIYYLWAAIALELLAKSTLAKIHPVLIADPTEGLNLLYACGVKKEYLKKKTITASTLYERLTHVSKDFDVNIKNTCMRMASYRNTELHSGESPLEGLDQRVWTSSFWKAASIILKMQEKSSTDWIGDEEAERITKVIEDSTKLLEQVVESRIARKSKEYSEKFPPDSKERLDAFKLAELRSIPRKIYDLADALEEHNCPSCNAKAWLLGMEWEQDIASSGMDIHPDYGYEMPWDEVVTTYNVEGFRCIECGLILDGREEINFADLPDTFERTEIQEVDFEPDYGND